MKLQSYENYRVGTCWDTSHMILFDTDEQQFAGHDRLLVGHNMIYPVQKEPWNNRPVYIELYIPSRTAIVLISEANAVKYDIQVPDYIPQDISQDFDKEGTGLENIEK